MMSIKTRFAPSPTGRIHLGNVRTALFNVLLAKKKTKNTFLLRIEDTDKERSKKEYQLALQKDLKWLGYDWQEGPEIGGSHMPYNQAERQAIYDQYYQQLIDLGLAYPCYCSSMELKLVRKSQLAAGQPPRYAGTCARLSSAEQEIRQKKGIKPSLRFRVPKNQLIEFDDFVRGKQKFQSADIGDFIIRRSDDSPAFFFTNAIDDALMGITHVMRGEDHISNTPRQLMLLQALNLPQPNYGHISLIVGQDGTPLSKRNGSRSVQELRDLGYLPLAINNHLARLGHKYDIDPFMSMQQLAENFNIHRLGKAPARHDESQLQYWQKEAVANSDDKALLDWLGNQLNDLISVEQQLKFIKMVRNNLIMPEDALFWAKQFFTNDTKISTDAKKWLKQAGDDFIPTVQTILKEQPDKFPIFTKAITAKTGRKGKQLFMPLRAAITGQTFGPQMGDLFNFIGIEGIQKQLDKFIIKQ